MVDSHDKLFIDIIKLLLQKQNGNRCELQIARQLEEENQDD